LHGPIAHNSIRGDTRPNLLHEPWHGLCRHNHAGDLRAQAPNQRRRAIILRSGGVVLLEGRSRTKRPRLAWLCKGRGRWRRCALMRTFCGIPAAIVTGVDRIRCPLLKYFVTGLIKRHRAGVVSFHKLPAVPGYGLRDTFVLWQESSICVRMATARPTTLLSTVIEPLATISNAASPKRGRLPQSRSTAPQRYLAIAAL
jgi:hypothetical protein